MRSYSLLAGLLFLAVALLSTGQAAEDVTLSTVIDRTDVTIWIPGNVPVIRGVYADPANAKVGGPWAEACRLWGFAQMGVMLQDVDKRTNRPNILKKVIPAALQEFAEKSGHKELVNCAFVFNGMSKGGGWSAAMGEAFADRTAGYANVCGWVANSKGSDTFLKVPGVFIMGETDPFKQLPSIQEQFEPGRARGARWAVAEQWGLAHAYGRAGDLVLPFLDQAIRDRIPADQTPLEKPVVLKDYVEEEGWLADKESWESNWATIAPFKAYQGDKTKAVWLPNEQMAWLWRAFMAKTPEGTITAPKSREALPGGKDVTISLKMNDGSTVTRVRLYDGMVPLGDAVAPDWQITWKAPAAGIHSLIATCDPDGGKPSALKPVAVIVTAP